MNRIIPKKELLIEILVEELPAIPFLKEKDNINTKWQNICTQNNLETSSIMLYTPRRLTLLDRAFSTESKSVEIQNFGPPLSIAYIDGDKNKGLSNAGKSFYTKNNLDLKSSCETILKDGKEVLYVKNIKQGNLAKDLLPSMIEEWLLSLNFGKTMAWGENISHKFIRPIRNICVLLDGVKIELEAFGVKSSDMTYGHRDTGFKGISVSSIDAYLDILSKNKVILDQDKRRESILEQIQDIQTKHNIKVEIDKDLLNEVVAITEYPRAIYGEFEKQYLSIPQEIIITSMKENQRYFATFKDGALNNGFVALSNGGEENIVKLGNQKVLRARLSDGEFFYNNDLKNPWQKDAIKEKLNNIVYVENLGSLGDKISREQIILKYLSAKFTNLNIEEALNASSFAKADLLSSVVGEFPELQGIIGGYYAKSFGLGEEVALAIKEQYLPLGEDSKLPSSNLASALALSIKLDNIFALFSIGKIPTGSKDPFALRRAANGILKIILANDLEFDLFDDVEKIYNLVGYQKSDISKISGFLIERLDSILDMSPNVFRSALRMECKLSHDTLDIAKRSKILDQIYKDNSDFISVFKRVANILKDFTPQGEIDISLLKEESEAHLYDALKNIDNSTISLKYANNLFALSEPLGKFFDNVMVNDKDSKIAHNRKMLCYKIYEEFLNLGDINELIR